MINYRDAIRNMSKNEIIVKGCVLVVRVDGICDRY